MEKRIDREKIAEYLKSNIEPIPLAPGDNLYRAAVTMIDGTYLSCVAFQSETKRVNHTIKRLDETRNEKKQFPSIVEAFVTQTNILWDYYIQGLAVSPFAIPFARMLEIKGETYMGWTGFSAMMKDGKEFQFGTSFNTEFFEMPPGYSAQDIVKITPATRGILPKSIENTYREKPFFNCYIRGI